jgi:hypothetical protein
MNKVFFTALLLLISLFSFSQIRVEAENYTSMQGVNIENSWGDGGGQNVAPIDQGDWMEYTIHPTVTGVHTFIFRVGTITTGGQFKVKKTDGTVLVTVNIPTATTYYQEFRSVSVNLNLIAGEQTIRIESTAATQWTFNWFEYSFGYKFKAELYTDMSGIGTAATTDGGGLCVGYIEAGDWIDYSVNLATAGTYAVKLRLAAVYDNTQLQIKNSGGTVLTTVNIPNTNGWDIWATVDASVTLPAGQQTLRIYASTATANWNINWWVLLPPSNPAPIVNAGDDQTIALPVNSTTLNGSATDGNGIITSYAWTKTSGPNNPTFGSVSSATTTVSGLVQGTYVFKLTAIDNEAAPGMDEVTVTVDAASTTGSGWMNTGNAIDSAFHFIGTTNSQPLIFKTNNIKQARLTTSGVFEVKKLRVTQGGWADFVFDSSYRLRSLIDLKKFINTNKHLPDVPSAKEVINGGLDIGDNQAALLRKIEELTLYMIQLSEEVEKLKQQNSELKKHLDEKRN